MEDEWNGEERNHIKKQKGMQSGEEEEVNVRNRVFGQEIT